LELLGETEDARRAFAVGTQAQPVLRSARLRLNILKGDLMSAEVTRLNHAVLYVSDLPRSLAFYEKAFGFKVVDRMGDQAVFLRAANTQNHHDLALMSVGANAARPGPGSVGLYHLAWQVPTIEDLAEMASRLSELDALAGMSDHGVSKSLYGRDPDGLEFEVMYEVPREQWGKYAERAVVLPLDLQREIQRFGETASNSG
jgi:catechol-2,3-dioxygenase